MLYYGRERRIYLNTEARVFGARDLVAPCGGAGAAAMVGPWAIRSAWSTMRSATPGTTTRSVRPSTRRPCGDHSSPTCCSRSRARSRRMRAIARWNSWPRSTRRLEARQDLRSPDHGHLQGPGRSDPLMQTTLQCADCRHLRPVPADGPPRLYLRGIPGRHPTGDPVRRPRPTRATTASCSPRRSFVGIRGDRGAGIGKYPESSPR